MKNESLRTQITNITSNLPCSDGTGVLTPGRSTQQDYGPHTSCDKTRYRFYLPLVATDYTQNKRYPTEARTLAECCKECLRIFSEGMYARALAKVIGPF